MRPSTSPAPWRLGIALVHSVQMMNKLDQLEAHHENGVSATWNGTLSHDIGGRLDSD